MDAKAYKGLIGDIPTSAAVADRWQSSDRRGLIEMKTKEAVVGFERCAAGQEEIGD